MSRRRRLIQNLNQTNVPVSDLGLFWQYPVITEKVMSDRFSKNQDYLSIPWATCLDKKINLDTIREGLKKNEKNTTCCQHIRFRELIPFFTDIGIQTLYTPHKIIGEDEISGIKILPCPLYAVNFEDPDRNQEFQDIDFLEKERKLLYSFRGASRSDYMSDIREKIIKLPKKENILIENTTGWHFDSAVYSDTQNKEGKYEIGNDKNHYNKILLDSRFSLCPSGTGPNSIRFWESLACGSIPVLLSDKLDLGNEVEWKEAIIILKESELDKLDSVLEGIDSETEKEMRKKCLHFYNKLGLKYKKEEYTDIIHYCCGSYDTGGFGGVARYDYQIKLAFPKRKFFEGPRQKFQMLEYLTKCKNPLVITDNHLSCDIPNKYNILLVHHGCAKTTALRTPDWGEPWKSLCLNGQNKMLDYRNPSKTTIISISQSCADDFTKYYGEKYTKFKRLDILHPSELDETRYKTSFNSKPVILGNWNHPKKGQKIIPVLKKKLKDFEFRQLSVGCNNKNFKDFNRRKQDIYLGSDIFLQIATSEGNSYATLDAMICGLVVVASNVGLFYKDVPDNCFIKLDWEKNNDINYVREKILEGWEKREELSKNCRKWYLDNCRFIDWERKMKIIEQGN